MFGKTANKRQIEIFNRNIFAQPNPIGLVQEPGFRA